ncbi:MAG: shikimate kinase [Desulfobacteraceae bacterium]|nr:shikimate kinase [Desulfobacteraceae bacterium]
MTSNENLILIGMPGAGKSTVGVLLAKQMGFSFLDSDLLIQKEENLLLHELISKLGLEAFLGLEANYIQKITSHRTVIATGGSVIYRSQAMNHLINCGRIIYLDIPFTPLEQRLECLNERGVVIARDQTLKTLFQERTPLYRLYSQLTVNTEGLNPEQVVHSIRRALGKDPLFAQFC